MNLQSLIKVLKGGPGSGNWGHVGRTGKRGGSAPTKGVGAALSFNKGRTVVERRDRARKYGLTVGTTQKTKGSADITAANRKQSLDDGEQLKGAGQLGHGFDHNLSDMHYHSDSEAIAEKMAAKANVTPEFAYAAASRWNTSSDHPVSRLMQAVVADELGVGMSAYQRNSYSAAHAAEGKELIKRMASNLATHKDLKGKTNDVEGDMRKLVRETYKYTQQELANRGITELTLSRGMKNIPTDHPALKARAGDTIKLQANALSSFSTREDKADNFGGFVVQTRVPASMIFSFNATGPGSGLEREFVVLGGKDPLQAVVRKNVYKAPLAYDPSTPDLDF